MKYANKSIIMTEDQLITVPLDEYQGLQQLRRKCQEFELENHLLRGTIRSNDQEYQFELKKAKGQHEELTVKLKELSKNGLKMARELILMEEALRLMQEENHSLKKLSEKQTESLFTQKEISFKAEIERLMKKMAFLEYELLDEKKTGKISLTQKQIEFSQKYQQIMKENQLLIQKLKELDQVTVELKNNQLQQLQKMAELERQTMIFAKRIVQLQSQLQAKQKELRARVKAQFNVLALSDGFKKEKQNYVQAISALKAENQLLKDDNTKIIAQNDKLKIDLIDIQRSQEQIFTDQREINQIRDKYQKSQQQLKRASEQLIACKHSNFILLTDYDNFFTSYYFMKEMQIREQAIRACQTIMKIHMINIKKVIRCLSTEEEKTEIFQHERQEFVKSLRKRFKDKQFLRMI